MGARSAVMWVHHKGRATTSEGRRGAPFGSLLWAFGGRRERLTVGRHRLRVHSYPKDQSSDHTYHRSVKEGAWNCLTPILGVADEVFLLGRIDVIADEAGDHGCLHCSMAGEVWPIELRKCFD